MPSLEGALKMLIGVTEKSGNLRNDLKQEILKAVKQSTTFVQAKNKSQSADYIKAEIKSKINPAEIKVGISGFKNRHNGKTAIESTNEKEIEVISRKINEQYFELQATTRTRFNPCIVVFNVGPNETIDNAAEIIASQNADFNISENDIKPQFVYKNKKRRKTNLVVELTPDVRVKLIRKKLKIG